MPPPRRAKALPPPDRVPLFALLGILLTGLVVFGRIIGHQLTNWDDDINITNNPNLDLTSGDGFLRIWTQPYEGLYIPLTYTSWLIDRALVGTGSWSYFAVNLLLHLFSTVVVFWIVRLLVERTGIASTLLPIIVAGGFCLHPMQVESVAWATGRKDLLSGFFFLGTLALWLRLAPGYWHYRLVAALFGTILSTLAKPSGVVLPVWLLLITLLIPTPNRLRECMALIPAFAMAIAMGILNLGVQKATTGSAPPFTMRITVMIDSLSFYWQKLILPMDLAVIYGRTPAVVLDQGILWGAVVLTVGMVACSFLLKGLARLGIILYFTFLLPVSGIVPFYFQEFSTVADRYNYLGIIGMLLVVGTLAIHAANWVKIPRPGRMTGGIVILGVLSLISMRQAGIWANSERLWEHVRERRPNELLAMTNLASVRNSQGRFSEGKALAEQALAIRSESGANWNNLGVAFQGLGDHAKALEAYQKAHKLLPQSAEAAFNAANLAIQLGEPPTAHLDALLFAAAKRPTLPNVQLITGLALSISGRDKEAMNYLTRAIDQAPSDPRPLVARVRAMTRLGRLEGAAIDKARLQAMLSPAEMAEYFPPEKQKP